jgi:predicted PurR-regulated permease PerM
MPSSASPATGRRPGSPPWDPAQLALLALTALALYLCWLMARPFVASLAWAGALAVVAWPLHRRIARQLRSPGVAAAVSTSTVLLVLGVPTAALTPRVVSQTGAGLAAIRDWLGSGGIQAMLDQAPRWLQPVFRWAEANVDAGAVAQRAGDLLAGLGGVAVRASLDGMLQLLLTFFLLYYFLRDRDAVLRRFTAMLPLSRAEARTLLRTVGDTVYATLLGKVLVSAMQGALVGLMFAWLGLTAPWFWGAVTAVVALVPILGPPVVWGPAALMLALDGHWGAAAALTVWGATVVGLADNVVYPAIVGNQVRLHTVPMLLSMIGGLFVFGLAGFFVGPVVLSATIVLLHIWHQRAGSGEAPPDRLRAARDEAEAEDNAGAGAGAGAGSMMQVPGDASVAPWTPVAPAAAPIGPIGPAPPAAAPVGPGMPTGHAHRLPGPP